MKPTFSLALLKQVSKTQSTHNFLPKPVLWRNLLAQDWENAGLRGKTAYFMSRLGTMTMLLLSLNPEKCHCYGVALSFYVPWGQTHFPEHVQWKANSMKTTFTGVSFFSTYACVCGEHVYVSTRVHISEPTRASSEEYLLHQWISYSLRQGLGCRSRDPCLRLTNTEIIERLHTQPFFRLAQEALELQRLLLIPTT